MVDRVDVAVDERQHIGPSIFNLENNYQDARKLASLFDEGETMCNIVCNFVCVGARGLEPLTSAV